MSKSPQKLKKELEGLTRQLLDLLAVPVSFILSEYQDPDSGETAFYLALEAEDESGLLIGSHGATLDALQSFLTLAMKQKTGDWVRVYLDVGQWRERHEEYLADLARQTAERARLTGEPQHLYNLKPAQRRIIHLALSNEKDIATESQGEGENRYLIVKSS